MRRQSKGVSGRVNRARLPKAARRALSRRELLKYSVAAAGATATSGLFWRGAFAATTKLVVTTMPGPRWEGALRGSAAAYQAKHPDVEIEILVSPYAEHYQRIGTSLIEDSSSFDAHLFDPWPAARTERSTQRKILPPEPTQGHCF